MKKVIKKTTIKKAQSGDTIYSRKSSGPGRTNTSYKVKEGDKTITAGKQQSSKGTYKYRSMENPKAGVNDTLSSKKANVSTPRGSGGYHDYSINKGTGVEKTKSDYSTPTKGKATSSSSTKFKKAKSGGMVKKCKGGC